MAYEEFIAAVKAELADSNADWLAKIPGGTANHVPTTSNRFWANGAERDLIQKMGRSFGCHTCNEDIADADQSFIVDHIPPKEWMSERARFRYFPHCDQCAAAQSLLVRTEKHSGIHKALQAEVGRLPSKSRLGKAKVALAKIGVSPLRIRLLCGGAYSLSIDGRHGNPNSAERHAVNRKGRCHSCDRKQANFIYHADHCPPREFGMTSWFPALMAQLGAPPNNAFYFRPQCASCSHKQGQRCKKLVAVADKIATEVGVLRYRF